MSFILRICSISAMLLLVFLLAGSAEGRFSSSFETVSEEDRDTLAWRGYFPLALGNEWEYRDETTHCPSISLPCFHSHNEYRMRVEAELEIEGRPSFLLVRYHESGAIDSLFVRYDDETASVVSRRSPDDPERCFAYGTLCNLDHPAGKVFSSDFGYFSRSFSNFSWTDPPRSSDEIPIESWMTGKNLSGMSSDMGAGFKARLVHGIGLTAIRGGGAIDPKGVRGQAALRYARIGGDSYGESSIAVSATTEIPASSTFEVWPNPARGVAHVRTESSGPVMMYDLLGREVVRVEQSAQESAVMDITHLPAGLYLIRSGTDARKIVVL